MKTFTIFTMIYNEYELLRQWFESILHNVDPKSYSQILIFDDYSRLDSKVREYEDYLTKEYPNLVKVISFPEHRRIFHYSNKLWEQKAIIPGIFDYREFTTDKPNLGVGGGFDKAAEFFETDYVFYTDADTIFLKKSFNLLNKFSSLFELCPDAQIIGQMRGVEDNKIIETYGFFPYYEPRTGKTEPTGGGIGPVCGALRTSLWTKEKLTISFWDGHKLGATFGCLARQMDDRKESKTLSAVSYPVLTDLYMIHLGGAIIRRNTSNKELGFIFCKDVLPARGSATASRNGNTILNRYYGRGFLNINNEEYLELLKEKYSAPFDCIQPPIDESLVYTVD